MQAGERLTEISQALVSARQAATALPGFPGSLPASLREAYEVQRISRTAWPDRIAGWKVGGIPAQSAQALGSSHLVGPIYARRLVQQSGSSIAKMPVFGGGFAAIEPEFIIQIGATPDEDRMFIGAEIASSPIPAINDVGPLAVVCDFGNNNGLLIGDEIKNWRECVPQMTNVETIIDGEVVGSRILPDFRTDALAAYDFAFALAEDQDIEMPPGIFISTGAITGVHEAKIGAYAKLDFGHFGSIELMLCAQQSE